MTQEVEIPIDLLRLVGAIGIAITLVSLALSVRFAKREVQIRRGLEVLRVVLGAGGVLVIGLVGSVTSPVWLVVLAVVVGLSVGFAQGRGVEVTVRDGRRFARRTAGGITVWFLSLIGMQAAGILNRTGVFRVGQAVGLLAVAVTVGLIAGRRDSTGELQSSSRVASTTGVATVVLMAVAFVSVLGPYVPSAGAIDKIGCAEAIFPDVPPDEIEGEAVVRAQISTGISSIASCAWRPQGRSRAWLLYFESDSAASAHYAALRDADQAIVDRQNNDDELVSISIGTGNEGYWIGNESLWAGIEPPTGVLPGAPRSSFIRFRSGRWVAEVQINVPGETKSVDAELELAAEIDARLISAPSGFPTSAATDADNAIDTSDAPDGSTGAEDGECVPDTEGSCVRSDSASSDDAGGSSSGDDDDDDEVTAVEELFDPPRTGDSGSEGGDDAPPPGAGSGDDDGGLFGLTGGNITPNEALAQTIGAVLAAAAMGVLTLGEAQVLIDVATGHAPPGGIPLDSLPSNTFDPLAGDRLNPEQAPPKGEADVGPPPDVSRPRSSTFEPLASFPPMDQTVDGQLIGNDGDGHDGGIYSDTDGDGQADRVSSDRDGDGFFETVERDTDGDGETDMVGVRSDADGDGYFETAEVDTDGDGIPDRTGSVPPESGPAPERVEPPADGVDKPPDSPGPDFPEEAEPVGEADTVGDSPDLPEEDSAEPDGSIDSDASDGESTDSGRDETPEPSAGGGVEVSPREIDDIYERGLASGRSLDDLREDVAGLNRARGGSPDIGNPYGLREVETDGGAVPLTPDELADYRIAQRDLEELLGQRNRLNREWEALVERRDQWRSRNPVVAAIDVWNAETRFQERIDEHERWIETWREWERGNRWRTAPDGSSYNAWYHPTGGVSNNLAADEMALHRQGIDGLERDRIEYMEAARDRPSASEEGAAIDAAQEDLLNRRRALAERINGAQSQIDRVHSYADGRPLPGS